MPSRTLRSSGDDQQQPKENRECSLCQLRPKPMEHTTDRYQGSQLTKYFTLFYTFYVFYVFTLFLFYFILFYSYSYYYSVCILLYMSVGFIFHLISCNLCNFSIFHFIFHFIYFILFLLSSGLYFPFHVTRVLRSVVGRFEKKDCGLCLVSFGLGEVKPEGRCSVVCLCLMEKWEVLQRPMHRIYISHIYYILCIVYSLYFILYLLTLSEKSLNHSLIIVS